LAKWLPLWLSLGYSVLVTSDHGMDEDHKHNDNTEATRRVPLWLLGTAWKNQTMPSQQTDIADLILRALGLAVDRQST
jgi:phosphopentomutase